VKEQRIIEVNSALLNGQADYLPLVVESFLTDRRVQGAAAGTLQFYGAKLKLFTDYCEAQALRQISELTPDFLRRFMLYLSEGHNAGGKHAAFRSLRACLHWVEDEEIMGEGWKNPIRKLKAPKVEIEPIVPVSLEDVTALVGACEHGTFTGERDKAIFLALLDTGARAKELCSMNLEDMDLATGAIMITKGKGSKPRIVFIGQRTRRAVRAYLRQRKDNSPALWITRLGERLSYYALRDLMRRRAKDAGVENPSPHDFRRAFALQMLRNGADIFALQKLMGHADLQILRRYLAQTDDDMRLAHDKGGPVDNM